MKLRAVLIAVVAFACAGAAKAQSLALWGDLWAVEYATDPFTCKFTAVIRPLNGNWPATLASSAVTSQAQHQWLIDTFLTGPGEEQRILWLGGRDDFQEGTWRWYTNDSYPPMTFTAWQAGQPDNRDGCVGPHQQGGINLPLDEDYMAMNWHFAKGVPGAVRGSWCDLPLWGRREADTFSLCGEPPESQYLALYQWYEPFFYRANWSNTPLRSGDSTELSIEVFGSGPLTYQWKKWGQNLVDGVGSGGMVVSGAQTNTLRLENVALADDGVYVLHVSSPTCTQAIPMEVNVIRDDWCSDIDFSNDGLYPDTCDIESFLSVFAGGVCLCPGPESWCDSIDFNNDGLFPDTLDVYALLSIFAGGPCLR